MLAILRFHINFIKVQELGERKNNNERSVKNIFEIFFHK